jgi:hypothetical protein
MVTNMVLNNLLVSLVYELLPKYFYMMKHNLCILFLIHVGTVHIFILIKSYYINIDRGGVCRFDGVFIFSNNEMKIKYIMFLNNTCG